MYKLLIAEDELSTRKWFAKAIDWEDLGFEVVAIVESGDKAWEIMLERPEIDVVMTDIRMPNMDGLELAAKIRTLPNSLHEVVILSGFGEFEYARQAIKYGVTEYILKPVTKETLSQIYENIGQRLQERYMHLNKLHYADLLKKEKEIEEKVHFYKRWLIRKSAFPNLEKELEQHGIRAVQQKKPYLLLLAEIDDYAEFSEMINDNDRKLCQFIVFNILYEVAQTFGAFDSVMLQPNLYLFLLQNDPNKDAKDTAFHIGQYFQLALKNYMKIFDVQLSVGASGLCDDISCLSDSYEQAAKALRNKFFTGTASVNVYDPSLESRKDGLYSTELEKKIIILFKQGDSEAGFHTMNQFLQSSSRFSESADSVRYVIGEMLVQLFRQLREVKSLPVPSKVMETLREEIQTQETFAELARKTNELIRFILDTIALEGLTLSFAAKGVEYIKLKLNRDISLPEVADYVGISPSYFSVLFKQEFGSNFVDFIIRLRMEKSLELLEKTEWSVARVGDEAGYRSYRYFTKVFKDYYGITPKQHRDRLKQL